jgi:DNA-directed RNA polymerase subunit omega
VSPLAKNTSENPKAAKRSVIPTDVGRVLRRASSNMRDDYLQAALKVIDDPNILVNVISRRVKQLKRGNRALVESLEKLSPEDTALREVMEGKISYELATKETLVHGGR